MELLRLESETRLRMYDGYSLAKLLKDCGFVDISVKNPFESDIPNWSKYELDVKNALVYAVLADWFTDNTNFEV